MNPTEPAAIEPAGLGALGIGPWRRACQHAGVSERALTATVDKFVAAVTVVLTGMAGDLPAPLAQHLGRDVAVEAFNLVLALVDADGRYTDDELWAVIAAFAHRFDTQLSAATPADVRKAGLVVGKRTWLQKPSVLFELIVAADARNRTAHAWTYYERAMDLGFLVCSLDARPSEEELRALEAWRGTLVTTMTRFDVARPGAVPYSSSPLPSATPAPTPGASGQPAVATPGPAGPTATAEAALPPARAIEDLLEELDGLVGLAAVKAEVKLVTNLLQVQKLRKERKLPTVESSHHLVFTGNPGTGKTTVARLLAQFYRTLGVVAKGQLVETDRAGLVAGFVGQTALKVTEVFDRADGGVLLIDEAYALARGGERDFGREAIDTIVKLVEDRRDDLVVIAAGYPVEMQEFVDANPGLRSRFPKAIYFADYSDDELVLIFASLCRKNRYSPTDDALARVRLFFVSQPRVKGFGNGRLARNVFETAIANQATRLVGRRPDGQEPSTPTDEQLLALEATDIPGPPELLALTGESVPLPGGDR